MACLRGYSQRRLHKTDFRSKTWIQRASQPCKCLREEQLTQRQKLVQRSRSGTNTACLIKRKKKATVARGQRDIKRVTEEVGKGEGTSCRILKTEIRGTFIQRLMGAIEIFKQGSQRPDLLII